LGIVFDPTKATIYFSDSQNNRIRKLSFNSSVPLAVIVVPSVLGGILCIALAVLIVVIVVYLRKDRKKKKLDLEKDEKDEKDKPDLGATELSEKEIVLKTLNFDHNRPSATSGTIMKNIQVVEKVASGQYGEVFRGIWNKSIDVALKKLTNQQAMKDFTREAALLEVFQHPNIVQYLGVFQENSSEFIVTEYMSVGELSSLLQKNESKELYSWFQLMIFCREACSGMVYLESQGVVHRDLACRNLLVNSSSVSKSSGKPYLVVKIADFGMSRILESHYYSSSNYVFPIKWCPPEVLSKRSFSHKSDIWSFGVTMWEVFSYAQTEPFPGKTPQEAGQMILNGTLLESPPSCPENIFSLMLDCWQKESKNRPNFKTLYEGLEVQFKNELPQNKNTIYSDISLFL
jgi:serine/threonine protein kinase